MTPEIDRYVEAQDTRFPSLGLGTWQIEGDACVEAVADALRIGYRHVDTAQAYGNEREVGEGVRRSGVDRDSVWVTTKVARENLRYDACRASVEESLRQLDVGPIDLLLIHWPHDEVPLSESLSAMDELRSEGKVRHLGVSNFPPSLLEEAVAWCPILCNQVEYHPFLAQDRLLRLAHEHDLVLTAYSPLARGEAVKNETLRRIGLDHGKSAAQVTLRWLVQQARVAAIPRASGRQHRLENFDVFDFELTDAEMESISQLDEGMRLIDPAHAPAWTRETSRSGIE